MSFALHCSQCSICGPLAAPSGHAQECSQLLFRFGFRNLECSLSPSPYCTGPWRWWGYFSWGSLCPFPNQLVCGRQRKATLSFSGFKSKHFLADLSLKTTLSALLAPFGPAACPKGSCAALGASIRLHPAAGLQSALSLLLTFFLSKLKFISKFI